MSGPHFAAQNSHGHMKEFLQKLLIWAHALKVHWPWSSPSPLELLVPSFCYSPSDFVNENLESRGWYCSFIYRRSQIQILIQRPAILTGSSSSSYGSTAQCRPWPPLLGFRNNNLFTGLDC
jgi:hypothetical protein